jgi:hypothetical protein
MTVGGRRVHICFDILHLFEMGEKVTAAISEVRPGEEVVVRITNLCPRLVAGPGQAAGRIASVLEPIYQQVAPSPSSSGPSSGGSG